MRCLRRRRKVADPAAANALKEATEILEQTKRRGPEVRRVSRELRILRERNHFAEKLEIIMEGPS